MQNLLRPTLEKISNAFTDITEPQIVQVQIDQNKNILHINVDGICILRICRSKKGIYLEELKF